MCIYCFKKYEKENFSREHVFSQCMGICNEMVLISLVCHECNNRFSKLETKFKENTIEGVQSGLWGLGNSKTSRQIIDASNFKLSSKKDLGLLKEVFPSLDMKGNLYVEPQVVFTNSSGRKTWFFLDRLEEYAKKQNSEFRKKKGDIAKLSKKNIHYAANEEWSKARVDKVFKDYGIEYNEKQFQSPFSIKDSPKKIRVEISGFYDSEIFRVIAKTAFNLLAFYCKEKGFSGVLYKNSFNEIRQFILFGHKNPDNFVKKLNTEIYEGQEMGSGLNVICFYKKSNKVIGQVSFLGFQNFEIILGDYPFNIDFNFSYGVIFNPFNRKLGMLKLKNNIF